MLGFFKGKNKKSDTKTQSETVQSAESVDLNEACADSNEVGEKTQVQKKATSLFSRFKQGLAKTRNNLSEKISDLFLGKKTIDADILEALETILLTSDVGVLATERILATITEKVKRKELNDQAALMAVLEQELMAILTRTKLPNSPAVSPKVILVIGTNGSGKTTSIGKLAHYYQQQGQQVMLAAGDTFRAAACEQLKQWGDKLSVPVISQDTGADSASVIFDAYQSAKAKGIDILLADTAGRLHTQNNLLEELKKIARVMKKIDPSAPHEVLLVLDAGFGQNAIQQTQVFSEAMSVSGIILTKLDGTAKGGVAFAIVDETHIPIQFIGLGEKAEDLKLFDPELFVKAILE